jgi:hypothetical protein
LKKSINIFSKIKILEIFNPFSEFNDYVEINKVQLANLEELNVKDTK